MKQGHLDFLPWLRKQGAIARPSKLFNFYVWTWWFKRERRFRIGLRRPRFGQATYYGWIDFDFKLWTWMTHKERR